MGLRPDILAEWCFNFTKAGAPLALTIYRLSMEQGEIVSSYSYAALLYRGAKGVPADKVRGRAILESLANVNKKATINKNGFAPAMAAMGGIYARDDGNMEMAEKYYVRAAQCGVPDAQLALGRMYLNGELPYNPSKAKLYLQVAAENDRATDKANAETHFMLGSLEQRMGKPDVKRAFQHFQKAASKGLPEAQYNVGQSYFVGMGVPKNDALAVEYWKMSAQQGFGLAQLSLGAYYFQDEVPQEQTIPGSEASAGGDKPATTKHVWDSSKKDLLQAQKWFTLASRRSGDLGLEGKRLRGKVEEAMRKGKGARDGKCTIM
ncbi:hypothetical protein BGW38_009280 [Lunasporangiospora selenospora]|uniref:TPR repeat n=1 Tax=Lunasporangiospora selenospora TaxID=979761 RepID=A0A9P6FXF6_9FUNG|nr:hypothetical protein BGW38_009280 [Lunasporangiospora selenospora]